ncbi:Transcriptional activator DEMETER [Acorus calamus]|uniref:Transcriptional activator DEMETER n=1 Tax=Acorus calamus TaxID=4465 RepID=A0AAV9DL30_ACOCL|nr:Transcriptional activator DEMETER [Acorus calamus]
MTRMIDDYIGSPSANTASVPQTDSRKQQGREKLKDIARQKNVKSDDVNGDIQRQPTTLAEAHFQLMQVNKRKRTEKIYIDLTNETTSKCGSTIINNNIECVWSANHAQSPNQEVQSRGLSNQMNLLSTPNQMDGTKKRRSKAPTRSRNLSSLTFSLDCKQNPLENVIVGEPQACVEALKVVNAKLKTRRRTKKGGQTGGANFLALVPYTDPMEELIKKLASLDINAIENAMVPYVANGTMVPFQPVKKRRPRARVILDDETLRLHKHLMLKASGDGSETMDEEKARWWEKEREIFRRRTDSFIRRMHEIQGDRTFSPWKGSVVDSVVGVFLTQNVSDHLSSSAFMALAARFPLHRQDMTEVPNAEEVSTSAEPQQIGIVELDSPTNESLCQGSCSQECMVRQEGEITEVGDSVVCRISKEKGLQSSPENRRDMRVTVMESTSVAEAEDSRSLDGISSQNSVISSQNSSEYPIVIADRMGSSSESNSEVEDLLTGNSGFESSMTSFMDLLQMAGNGNFKDLYANGYRSYTEETSVTAAHQLNFPGGPQRNLSFDLNNIQCGSQSTSMFNSPLMRESANSKDTLNVSYNSYHLHSSMQPGKFDRENVGSFQEISRSLPSAASELTVHNNKDRICGLGAGNTSIATAPYVQQTPQTAPASNIHSLISTGKDAKNEVHPPSHSGLCCERTLAISENNTEPVCPGSQVSRTVNIHQKEREPNVHVEGTRKTEYTNLLEGLAQRKGNVPADHTSTLPNHSGKSLEGNSKIIQNHEHSERKESDSLSKDVAYSSRKIDTETPKRNVKGKKITDETEKMSFDWDSLRREACCGSLKKERNRNTMDSLDWEAVRTAPVEEISNTIRERGMNNMLAERIKAFLNRVVQDHGSIDLEWLREVPPDKVKEYLLSIRGLGLKSVECVRLLTLHHLAFPVDTNVGRICVRLGWVPLEPLPESLQLHLLEMYPILESIQKYLWPRLCTLDQRTLYELHYQLITFGKVFCTKSKPNCNACPLKMECKHFASAFASARLALPGPEDKSLVTSTVPFADGQSQKVAPNPVGVPQIEGIPLSLERSAIKTCEPIIEEPTTPEPPEPERIEEVSENDIEEAFWQEDPDEIPPIVQDYEALKQNIQSIIESSNMDIENSDLSKALVALTPAAASIPMPKLKNVNRLRTEHRVYELPDTHPLLKGMDHREPDDPCSYLLAIWTPGETAQSFQPPETCCNSKETGALCHNETCFSCKSIQEANSHTVRGTLLIPCRTAMRGSFPLNGTYFQVNEVFADHDSSQNPIIIPRKLIWNLPRRTVYFGTSVPSIFKGYGQRKYNTASGEDLFVYEDLIKRQEHLAL